MLTSKCVSEKLQYEFPKNKDNLLEDIVAMIRLGNLTLIRCSGFIKPHPTCCTIHLQTPLSHPVLFMIECFFFPPSVVSSSGSHITFSCQSFSVGLYLL